MEETKNKLKTNTVEPIKPSEVQQIIPDWIIEGTNECIQDNFVASHGESHFTQKTLLKYVMKHRPNENITSDMIFKNHWLDIEPIYEKAGWKVDHDKPAYCENYEANFTFSTGK